MDFKKEMPSTFNELVRDPAKYGLPTFKEYCANRGKFIQRDDDIMSEVDRGPERHRSRLKRIVYEFKGIKCKTLEAVAKVAADHGIDLSQIDYVPECIPQGSVDYDLKIVFLPKPEKELHDKKLQAKRKGIILTD